MRKEESRRSRSEQKEGEHRTDLKHTTLVPPRPRASLPSHLELPRPRQLVQHSLKLVVVPVCQAAASRHQLPPPFEPRHSRENVPRDQRLCLLRLERAQVGDLDHLIQDLGLVFERRVFSNVNFERAKDHRVSRRHQRKGEGQEGRTLALWSWSPGHGSERRWSRTPASS